MMGTVPQNTSSLSSERERSPGICARPLIFWKPHPEIIEVKQKQRPGAWVGAVVKEQADESLSLPKAHAEESPVPAFVKKETDPGPLRGDQQGILEETNSPVSLGLGQSRRFPELRLGERR